MLTEFQRSKLSTTMSYILRHKPHEFGVVLDNNGYCGLDDLLYAFQTQSKYKGVELEDILQVVKECKKQRFEIIEERIRARYGHSFKRLEYSPSVPPTILYHGTHTGVVDKISATGIKKMNREYVHMSESTDFAALAGKRRGELVMLMIDSKKAFEDGIKFYYAGNEVWLADYIPPEYITVK